MNQMQKQAVMIVIEKDGKFLLGKRADWKSQAPGFWCPVSGHLEPGETEEEAVTREAREEVGLIVRPTQKITQMDTHDRTVRLHWWRVEVLSGTAILNNDENSELGWFSREELDELTPAFQEDLAILKSLS